MEAADEIAFNDTFNHFVRDRRKPRPIEVMRHIWHNAPGGKVMSWLAEARMEDGKWKIIAHHGLCPSRFTMGGDEFLFAKTVNSFLLPEYRGKFLYLRMEKDCLAEVDHLFDATYTLTPNVTRIRAALGYDVTTLELSLERGLQPIELCSRLLFHFAGHRPVGEWLAQTWAHAFAGSQRSSQVEEFDSVSARTASFFTDFWSEARGEVGLAPRRDAADLDWRFWSSGAPYITFAHRWQDGTRGFAIVRRFGEFHFSLEDFALSKPRPELVEDLLRTVLLSCRRKGALKLSFMTTEDSYTVAMREVLQRLMKPVLSRRYRHSHMSRRLTARGVERLGNTWPPCTITPIVAMA